MNTMSYKCYEAVVEYDEDAEIFHGEVMNTRDVTHSRVDRSTELKAALAESVEDYLACCRERGEKPEKPTLRQLGRATEEARSTVGSREPGSHRQASPTSDCRRR